MRRPAGMLALMIAVGTLTLAGIAPGALSIAAASTGPQASPLVSGLSSPNGLATDAAGDLFIANAGANGVSVVVASGVGSIFGQGGFTAGTAVPLTTPFSNGGVTLSNPTALAFDSEGDLFIANNGDADVVVVPAASGWLFGQYVYADIAVVLNATENSGLTNPQGVAVDSSGNLYVSDYSTQAVYVLPADGTSEVFGQSVTPAAESEPSSLTQLNAASGLSAPAPVAFDSNGDLYIGDQGNGQVDVVPADDTASGATLFGQPVAADTLASLNAVSGLQTPGGLAFDSSGDLYVTDLNEALVDEVSPSGAVSTPAGLPSLGEPSGIAVDSYDDLYVADYESGNVYELPGSSGSGNGGGAGQVGHVTGASGTAPCPDSPDSSVKDAYYDFAEEKTTVWDNAGDYHCGDTVPDQSDYDWEAIKGEIWEPDGPITTAAGDTITRVNASFRVNFEDRGFIAIGWLEGWVNFTGPRPPQPIFGQCEAPTNLADVEGDVDLTAPEMYVQIDLPGESNLICDEGPMPHISEEFEIAHVESEADEDGPSSNCWLLSGPKIRPQFCTDDYPSLPDGGAFEAGLSMYSLHPSCTDVPSVLFGGNTTSTQLELSRAGSGFDWQQWQLRSNAFPYGTIRYDESNSIDPTAELSWPDNPPTAWSEFTASIGSSSGCAPPTSSFPPASSCTYWAEPNISGTYYHFAQEMTAAPENDRNYRCGPVPHADDYGWSGVSGDISEPAGKIDFATGDTVTRVAARMMVNFQGGGYIAVGWLEGWAKFTSFEPPLPDNGQCNNSPLPEGIADKTVPTLYIEVKNVPGIPDKLCDEGAMPPVAATFGLSHTVTTQGSCWNVEITDSSSHFSSIWDQECSATVPSSGAIVAGLSSYSSSPSCTTVPTVTFGEPGSSLDEIQDNGAIALLRANSSSYAPWAQLSKFSNYGTMRYDESTSADPTTTLSWPTTVPGYQWSYFQASMSHIDGCSPPQFPPSPLAPPPDFDFEDLPWELDFGTLQPPALSIGTTSLPNGVVGVGYSPPALQETGDESPYFWSLESGQLPPGLDIGTLTGVISGMPTTAGTYCFTVEVSGGDLDGLATETLSITISPPLSITTSSVLTGTEYETISATFDGAGGLGAANGGAYAFSLGGTPPPGCTTSSMNPDGAFSCTPTTPGNYTLTVVLQNDIGEMSLGSTSVSYPFVVVAPPPLSITTSSSLTGTQYEPITATFSGAGGVGAANGGAYAFSLGGTLPPGCTASSMNPDGAFSCLPTTPGNYTLTVVLQNDIGETSLSSTSVNFPFVVTAPPSLSISTSSLLTGTEYQTIAATFYGAGGLGAANGGAYVFSLGGNLPPGCSTSSMSPNGYFSCLPTTPGHYTLTVVLQNDIGQIALGSTSVGYPFVVAAPPALSITPSSISSATIDTAYGVTFSGAGGITAPNGGAYKFLISGGNLPPGCTTSSMSAGGYFSCTPAQTGSYTFTVTLQNEIGQLGVGSTSLNVTLVVVLPSPLSITPSSIPSATPNASYAVTFSGAGGVTAPKGGAYDFLITGGNLPSGCSTSSMSAGGQFSCTPSVPGSYTFTVTLQNDIGQTVVGSTSENVTLTVLPFPTPLSITTSSVPDGSISASYGTVLKGTGGSNIGYTWQVVRGGVPGLSLSFYNGTLSGTPSAAGVYSFTVQLNDNAGDSAQASYTMVVAPLSITAPSAVDSATVGSPYSAKFSATGGCGCSYSYWVSGGSIPSWLNFNGNGYMSGTPNTSGRYNFTVAVSDGAGNSATVPVTLTVSGYGQLSISSTAFQSGLQVGSGFAVTFSGAGGCGCGYNWSIASGGVPGLSLTSSGWLHGTVTTPGVYSFTVLVQDGAGNVAEETYTVLVDE